MFSNLSSYLFGSYQNGATENTATENQELKFHEIEEEDDWMVVDKLGETSGNAENDLIVCETTYDEPCLEDICSISDFDEQVGERGSSSCRRLLDRRSSTPLRDMNCVLVEPSPVSLYNVSKRKASSRSSSKSSTPCCVEESWYMTPPPCFVSGPYETKPSSLENLLIEQPGITFINVNKKQTSPAPPKAEKVKKFEYFCPPNISATANDSKRREKDTKKDVIDLKRREKKEAKEAKRRERCENSIKADTKEFKRQQTKKHTPKIVMEIENKSPVTEEQKSPEEIRIQREKMSALAQAQEKVKMHLLTRSVDKKPTIMRKIEKKRRSKTCKPERIVRERLSINDQVIDSENIIQQLLNIETEKKFLFALSKLERKTPNQYWKKNQMERSNKVQYELSSSKKRQRRADFSKKHSGANNDRKCCY